MDEWLPRLIFFAGIGQLGVLVASALVPLHLNWRESLAGLPRLLQQLFWTYGGYIVLSITSFGLLSVTCSEELASGGRLARGVSLYMCVFWAIRLALQTVFDVGPHLTRWWLRGGYYLLTGLFLYFTLVFGYAAFFVTS